MMKQKQFKSKTYLYELRKLQTSFPKVQILTSRNAYDFIKQFFGDDIEVWESFYILSLNSANNTLGFAKISQGGMTSTVVDVRIVAQYAMQFGATQIICCHNHPSGNLQPSEADKRLTAKLVEALGLLDIKVLDHLIIGPDSDNYYSFGDEGMMMNLKTIPA